MTVKAGIAADNVPETSPVLNGLIRDMGAFERADLVRGK
jgi:hypothetical protein